MRFDVENQLCRAQAFTGAATVSDYSFDMQDADRDMFIGRRMALFCAVTTAAGSGSTHTMEAITATDAALTGSVTSLISKSIAAATLVAGYVFELPIPQGVSVQRYLGFKNTSTGGTTTVSLDVYLMPQDEIDYYKSFPKVVDADVS
jgi:hypothetical protein